jgi:hypothetical protein
LELVAKQIELLMEAFPERKRLGALWDVLSADQFAAAERETKARQLTLRAIKMENPPYDFDPAFRALAQDGVDMLHVLGSPLFSQQYERLAELTIQHRLPNSRPATRAGRPVRVRRRAADLHSAARRRGDRMMRTTSASGTKRTRLRRTAMSASGDGRHLLALSFSAFTPNRSSTVQTCCVARFRLIGAPVCALPIALNETPNEGGNHCRLRLAATLDDGCVIGRTSRMYSAKCSAKVLSIARHGAPLVPLDNIAVSQRLPPVRYPGNFQPVAIGPQYRWNNGNPLPGFGEREQRVRRAALKKNIGLDVGETAGRVEQPANRVPRFQQQ